MAALADSILTERPWLDIVPEAPRYWYAMYGSHVRSDIPLPFAPVSAPRDRVPAWEFCRAAAGRPIPVPDARPDAEMLCCDVHRKQTASLHRRPEGTIIKFRAVGTFWMSPDA